MSDPIPFALLGVPQALESKLERGASRKIKLALARGVVPLPAEQQLPVLFILASDEHPKIAGAAKKTASALPVRQVLGALGMKTHPKILEFLAEFREPDVALDARIGMLRTANDRTVRLIVRRANTELCHQMCQNHERLLMTPDVFLDLHANEACHDVELVRAESFLRMQRSLPAVPAVRPFRATLAVQSDASAASAAPAPAPASQPGGLDLLAEIEAAIRGDQSPALLQAQESGLDMFSLDNMETSEAAAEELEAFNFSLSDNDMGFSWDLSGDGVAEEQEDDQRVSLEAQIGAMTVGQRIKLGYRGNKEMRSILIRDSNKMVASAVVKSGRLTDSEVASYAGNKNLDNEVLREIASNGEWVRKYPVKVALVNNPKTPVAMAVGLVSQMHKKDLMMLTRNRNVPSVVAQAANRLYRKKYRK